MKKDYEAIVQYDQEALLYKGDAWTLASQHKITYTEYNNFCRYIVNNSDLEALIAEYKKLLTLANSREGVDGK